MNKKPKIIILTSSISLGVAIILSPFLGKSNFPKNHHQQLVKKNHRKNNQRLNQKKRKSSFFWIVLAIIGIGILMIAIFIIRKIIWNRRLQKFLSGRCYPNCPEKGKIYLYFCPSGQVKNNIKEQLYHLDIENQPKLPSELQEIYDDLNTKNKKELMFFGELINIFFKLIDGHLLYAVYKYSVHYFIPPYFEEPITKINKHLKNKGFTKNNFEIYNETIFPGNAIRPMTVIQKNKKSIDFFKSALDYNKYIVCYQKNNEQKYFLFRHYYAVYELISDMFKEISDFFNENADEKYCEQYQKIKNAKRKIDDFLGINHQPND